MDGDALRKVTSGEPFVPQAEAHNQFIDAAQFAKRHKLTFEREGGFRNGDIIDVRNDTGQDLHEYAVVGLGAPLVSPFDRTSEFLSRTTVAGVVPTAEHRGKFGVLLAPLRDGRIGRAWVSGVFAALINVLHEENGFADVGTGIVSSLESGDSGAAKILWREGGLGPQWAIVRMSGAGDAQMAIVKIWQKASAMGPLTSCTGSGETGSGAAQPCLSWMHVGLLQTWDPDCDRWVDGACVRVIDLEGQPLVEGRRYFAQRLSDDWPEGPTAFTYPIDGPCNSYVQTSPVYGVNAGNPVRQIFIEAELGVYCPSGSGSGEGADDECVICNSDTLHIFEGNIQEFDVDTCTWKNTMKERVYVAATCGKKLWVGMRFNAVYHSIIPPIKGERDDEDDDGPPILEGSGGIHGRECQALYIVECRGLHGSFTSLTASGSTISEYYDTYVCGELICRDGPFPLGTCDCISGGGGGGGGGGIGGGVTSCCPNEIPATLHVSITGDATASGTITWNGSNCWLGTLTLCGQEVSVQFCCTGASCNGFIISIAGFANTGLCGGCSCDPLSFCTNMTTFSGLGSCPPGSSISVLVTE